MHQPDSEASHCLETCSKLESKIPDEKTRLAYRVTGQRDDEGKYYLIAGNGGNYNIDNDFV